MVKRYNNYCYLTEVSVQSILTGWGGPLLFKYGKGSSHKEDINERTEKRYNLNKPHEKYEIMIFCESQRDYHEREQYILSKLKNITDYHQINNSEFFAILNIKTEREIINSWYNLRKHIDDFNKEYDLYSLENNIKEDISEEDEDIDEDMEDNQENIEDGEQIINFYDYNPNIHSLEFSEIKKCTINNIECKNYSQLLRQVMIDMYNFDKEFLKRETKIHTENKKSTKYIADNFYYYNKSATSNVSFLKKIIKHYEENGVNYPVELKILLK